MAHLTAPQLLDYYKNKMNAADTAAAKAHLAECTTCQRELDKTVRLLTGLQQADFEEPNPSATQKLAQAFRKKQARLADRVRQTAALEFDSWANPATASVRRQLGQRQMLFSEGPYDIDIQVMNQTAKRTFDLQGQVLIAVDPEQTEAFPSLAGSQVRLRHENGDEWWGATDENGRFSFLQLSFGTYSFQLLLEDRDIVFDKLELLA